MIFTRYVMPSFFIAVSIVLFIATLNLQKAPMGDPYGPLYFPGLISIVLFITSLLYLLQELKRIPEKNKKLAQLFEKKTGMYILSTLLYAMVYAFIFERLGYLISTVLFLGAVLFTINGKKKWIVNLSVAVLFSFLSWYGFYHLLDISLP